MDRVVDILLGQGGLLGALLVAAFWVVWKLDQRIIDLNKAHNLALAQAQANQQTEHQQRLEDQRRYTTALLEQSDKVHRALDRTEELIDLLTTTKPRT